jgi:two-component system, chemotaxis family, sensor kinase CheA
MSAMSDKKIRIAFIEEVNELLDSLNAQLLHLENNPEDKDVINEVFRLTHSIKSEAALVGFLNISELSHKMEDIFDRIRTNNLVVNQEVMNTLFKAYDKIIKLINIVQEDGDESIIEINEELQLLDKILNVKSTPKKKEVKQEPKEGLLKQGEKYIGIEVKKGLIT